MYNVDEQMDKYGTIKELEVLKGYANSFEDMVNYIMQQLPSIEVIETALRKQIRVYPEIPCP